MKEALAFLLNLLEDEFSSRRDVRIRQVSPSTTRRSPDLIQDYDAEAGSVHRRAGILVQTRLKDYYFPVEWLEEKSRTQINQQISEIRERLGLTG